jgi:hypothetical protein
MSRLGDDSEERQSEEATPTPPPISAVRAAMVKSVARWIDEFTAANNLSHADLANREQAAQEVRVSRQLRTMFRTLGPEEKQDPEAIARTRARAAALISAELSLDPIEISQTPQEAALPAGHQRQGNDERT